MGIAEVSVREGLWQEQLNYDCSLDVSWPRVIRSASLVCPREEGGGSSFPIHTLESFQTILNCKGPSFYSKSSLWGRGELLTYQQQHLGGKELRAHVGF